MPILRDCAPALALALQGNVRLWTADIFKFVLVDGVTTYYWTSWVRDLVVDGQVYSSRKPWLNRSSWNVTNTMEVPSLTVILRALGDSFAGGDAIITQIHNGLFDGSQFLMSTAFMTTPDDTSTLGVIDLFGGEVAGLDFIDTQANITIKGKTNKLDQYAPRTMIQISCNHAFCDVGCTLNRALFTLPYVAGTSPTETFIPWAGAAPTNYANYLGGTLALTSGAASGARRTITIADATGLTLAYPLYALPLAGDTFTAFEGCSKNFNDGSGRDCTARSNTENFRGYDFVPPPTTAY